MGIPANACWLNSLANQEVYILNHSNIIYEHTMKLKCEMCPQDATFVVGCGNKTACSRCVTTRKCNPSRERATEITQQDAKECRAIFASLTLSPWSASKIARFCAPTVT